MRIVARTHDDDTIGRAGHFGQPIAHRIARRDIFGVSACLFDQADNPFAAFAAVDRAAEIDGIAQNNRVAIVQFVPQFGIPGVRHALSVILTAGGGIMAALAVRRWQRVQGAMRRNADLPPTHVPALLGVTIFAVTVGVLIVLMIWPPGGS